jgi:alpha/beta superfamily hydrolase
MSHGGDQQGDLQTPLDILGIMASQQAMVGPQLRHIEMYTRRGLLSILWHEPTGTARNVGVVMVGGAMGGVMGPGEALYHVLGEDFSARGVPVVRISYRKPNDMDSCCIDTAAAVQMLVGTGCDRVILMGHSFGGAVAIRVAVGLSAMVSGVVTFATQSAGCEIAGGLQGRPLLMFHGDRDEILPLEASEVVRSMAGTGELRVMPGDGHLLAKSHDVMREEVNAWCDTVFALGEPQP